MPLLHTLLSLSRNACGAVYSKSFDSSALRLLVVIPTSYKMGYFGLILRLIVCCITLWLAYDLEPPVSPACYAEQSLDGEGYPMPK